MRLSRKQLIPRPEHIPETENAGKPRNKGGNGARSGGGKGGPRKGGDSRGRGRGGGSRNDR
jgi:hypothetical protein